MSWSVSTGPVDRDKLWNAIDLLTATQPGLPEGDETLAHQLHHAKAAAKALCNSFDVGEYPKISVSFSGHVHTGEDSPSFVNVSAYGQLIEEAKAEEPAPAAEEAASEPAPDADATATEELPAIDSETRATE